MLDAQVTRVILGSFPSIQSLQKQQYYANPQNQFWRLLGESIGEPLANRPYEERVKCLLSHHIGLWDVHESCEREGSVDGNIRGANNNDLRNITAIAPRAVFFCNGSHAAAVARKQLGEKLTVLPSSSPANTIRYQDKLAAWKKALQTQQSRRESRRKSI